MKRRLLITLALGVTALGLAVAATAAQTEEVRLLPCAFGQNGKALVTAGSNVQLVAGWADAQRAYVRDFLRAQQTTVTVDGRTFDASGNWGPIHAIDGGYQSDWTFNAGTLSKGAAMQVSFDIALSEPINSTNEDGSVGTLPAGSIFGGIDCRIKAK